MGLGRPVIQVSISHTLGRTPLNESSAGRWGRYLHSTQQTHENIHALSRIWTRDPSNQADIYIYESDRTVTENGYNKITTRKSETDDILSVNSRLSSTASR
jgi:hypothetical protein